MAINDKLVMKNCNMITEKQQKIQPGGNTLRSVTAFGRRKTDAHILVN